MYFQSQLRWSSAAETIMLAFRGILRNSGPPRGFWPAQPRWN
jgi:hypothetical protein